jgi:hypothetical protein
LLGTFTGGVIRLISDIRLKHGRDAVDLSAYGRFVLADDLSDVADITHIDLSGIVSLEGACVFALVLLSLACFGLDCFRGLLWGNSRSVYLEPTR